MRMQDLRTWNPSTNQPQEPFPGHPVALAPPPKRAVPTPDHLSSKAVQTIHIAGNCLVVEVAFHDRLQPLPDLGYRLMEAARKTQLAKGEVGIQDLKPIPTLRNFAPQIELAIETQCAGKPRAVDFNKAKLKMLLADETLASARLDRIDEAMIEAYRQVRARTKSRRKQLLSAASVNRESATLRRLLRMAHKWKVIARVPRIRLLRGERQREFVLTPAQEATYLWVCPPRWMISL
jgi:hypothetical protein